MNAYSLFKLALLCSTSTIALTAGRRMEMGLQPRGRAAR